MGTVSYRALVIVGKMEDKGLKTNVLYTDKALVSGHLGNSERWSQVELVAYENGLS